MIKTEHRVGLKANKFSNCLFLLLFCAFCIVGQSFASAPTGNLMMQDKGSVTLNITRRSLVHILSEIKKQTGLSYGFKDSKNANKEEFFTINVKNVSVDSALNLLFRNSKYTYQIVGELILVSSKNEEPAKAEDIVKVKGKITDEDGNSIPGASVMIHGTTQGVASDADGRYELAVRPTDVLVVSFIGYKTEVVPIQGKETVNVALKFESENLEEVSVVAFGTQKKESVVSAISTVRPMDLKSSNSDLTSSFAGRIPGMIAWQTGGIPGALTEEEMNTKFYIRGITSFQTGANIDPLILIDGVESSKLDLSRIAPEDIETFSVLKDASATAMYGARGANGVIMVTTKKGEEGSVYASARYEAVFSMPTKQIDIVSPIDYMKTYNQAAVGRKHLTTPKYSEETIQRTASGKYPSWVYPANDWYDIMFKNYNINHHAGLSLRGGSKVIQYYASLNYNRDMGMLKTDKLNDFDCNINNDQTAFRVNLNIDIKAGIKLLINSSASLDKYHGPLTDMTAAYGLAFAASPVDFAPLYPADKNYSWPHLRFGTTEAEATNPYMLLHQGYMERTRYSTSNRAEYIQNLSSFIKGLELRASVSWVQSGYYYTSFSTSPYRYSLANYDFETGEHTLRAIRPEQSVRTLSISDKASTTETQVTYEAQLIHTAAWKEHQTSLTGVFQMQERTYTPVPSVLNGMPQRNLTFSMRGSYGWKDRYFVEGSFGYNGSERFAKNNRMGFFPAGGVAWVASSEPFMESVSCWIPYLKVRASYGLVGNDGIVSTPRFVFLPTIERDGTKYVEPSPGGGLDYYRYVISAYENKNIEWEIAEQFNLGIEAKLFGGLFEMTLDAFQERRHNVIGKRMTLPSSVGVEVAPLDNIGKSQMRGIDFSGKIQHAFSNDFWMILNGTLTYSKSIYKEIEEATGKPDWQRMRGQEISQSIGYIAEGLFRDQAEIDNSPIQGGDVMPGDIRYRDLNGDGVINVEDATYIGFPETPRLIYGFQGFFNYKNWEFSFAFQGSGKRSFFMNPKAISPFANDNSMLQEIYDSHWSEDNMDAHAFWPRLSTKNIVEHNPQEDWYNKDNAEVRKSTYFMRECSFLRCTSMELAYNMPSQLMERWKLQNMKFFIRTNNPFCISDFKIWDVELGENGFNYPIQKSYTIGLTFSF